jgi:hypothetical protein
VEKTADGRLAGLVDLRDKAPFSLAATARMSFGFRPSGFGLLSTFDLRPSDFSSNVSISGTP